VKLGGRVVEARILLETSDHRLLKSLKVMAPFVNESEDTIQ
jgi:hypothetical protein